MLVATLLITVVLACFAVVLLFSQHSRNTDSTVSAYQTTTAASITTDVERFKKAIDTYSTTSGMTTTTTTTTADASETCAWRMKFWECA